MGFALNFKRYLWKYDILHKQVCFWFMLVVDILGIRDSEEKDCYTTRYLPWVSAQKRWYRVSPRNTTKYESYHHVAI